MNGSVSERSVCVDRDRHRCTTRPAAVPIGNINNIRPSRSKLIVPTHRPTDPQTLLRQVAQPIEQVKALHAFRQLERNERLAKSLGRRVALELHIDSGA